MKPWTTLSAGFVLLLLVVLTPWSLAQTQAPAPPVREITQIAGEIYRVRNNNHYAIFAVTPAGIIATDPINAEAAQWLKTELHKRFAQPVKYLIYSHDHADHIAGGQVFADTAIVVAHENARTAIVQEKRPTAVPQVTFSERLSIELGGTVVELQYVGRNHSDNSIVMRFPKERLLFAVDFIPVEAVAFRDFPDAYIEDWIESLQRVEQLDFEALRGEVLKYAREGKSLEDMKSLIKMEKYARWAGYEQMLPLNIEGMYQHVQMHRRGN
jgi:glyoxylase-like metal-dependent hydrolase (beta-lactamase superfamily II)